MVNNIAAGCDAEPMTRPRKILGSREWLCEIRTMIPNVTSIQNVTVPGLHQESVYEIDTHDTTVLNRTRESPYSDEN